MGVSASDIDVAGVVSALRGVLQEVDGADRKRLALDDGVGAARGQDGAGHEGQRLKGTAWSEQAGARRSIVDQMRTLKVKTASPQIADVEDGVRPKTFFDLCIPLLNVLRKGRGDRRQ